MIIAADAEQQRCRCPLEKQVVGKGRSARLHLPRLVSTALKSFLLDSLLLGNRLGKFGLNRLHRKDRSADVRWPRRPNRAMYPRPG
jgi:hypothetical protein